MADISNEMLDELDRLSRMATPPPWRSLIEGRDHHSGDSFIQIGEDGSRGEDMYVSRNSAPASSADLDLIAAARTMLPAIIEELRTFRRNGA